MPSELTRCLVHLPAAAFVALGAACSSVPPKAPEPVPRELEIRVQASPQLNPDSLGRATPIVVRIYELRSRLSFEAADFFSLQDKDEATLGKDLVARQELQLRPGDSLTLPPRELGPDARAIGVLAAFRDLERSRWRAVAALPDPPPPVLEPPERPLAVPVTITLGTREVRVTAQ